MNSDRWKLAQTYEKNWWEKNKSLVTLDYHEACADEIRIYSKQYKFNLEAAYILEIGSGAIGHLACIKESNNRYAIDPLDSFYASIDDFKNLRDAKVNYITGKGEELPFPDSMFDFVIIDNVLDHCDNPNKVMNELKRVTKPAGYIYFKQNTYHFYGKMIRGIMEFFKVDKGHPYTYTKNQLRKIVSANHLVILESQRSGYFKTWKKEFFSNKIMDKIKALLFVNRDKVTYFIQKS